MRCSADPSLRPTRITDLHAGIAKHERSYTSGPARRRWGRSYMSQGTLGDTLGLLRDTLGLLREDLGTRREDLGLSGDTPWSSSRRPWSSRRCPAVLFETTLVLSERTSVPAGTACVLRRLPSRDLARGAPSVDVRPSAPRARGVPADRAPSTIRWIRNLFAPLDRALVATNVGAPWRAKKTRHSRRPGALTPMTRLR